MPAGTRLAGDPRWRIVRGPRGMRRACVPVDTNGCAVADTELVRTSDAPSSSIAARRRTRVLLSGNSRPTTVGEGPLRAALPVEFDLATLSVGIVRWHPSCVVTGKAVRQRLIASDWADLREWRLAAMDASMKKRSGSSAVLAAIRIGLAVAVLSWALGCTMVGSGSRPDAMTAVSASRCAPGSLLDDRHALCNGMSGRWW